MVKKGDSKGVKPELTSGAVPVGVTFDGSNYFPLQPISRPGREAYPGAGDPGNGNALNYLKVRRDAETHSSQLWRVYDKLYDFEKYLDFHPGGRHWLEYLRGCDCTESFESHHMDIEKARRVLDKFYVRDVEEQEFLCGDRFTYDENGFWDTLRTRCLARLKEEAGPNATTMEATAATPAMKTASAIVVSQFAAAWVATLATGSAAAAALSGFFLVGCWGVGHNFMHQAMQKGKYWRNVLDLCPGFSAENFQVTHALSHHPHTNLAIDYETAHYTADGTQGYPNPVMKLRNWFGTIFVVGALNAVDHVTSALRHLSFTQLLSASLPFAQVASFRAARGSWREAVKLWMIQNAAFYGVFVPFSLAVHHNAADPNGPTKDILEDKENPRPTMSWHEGELGGVEDFGHHQVLATEDHTVFSSWPGMPEILANWLSLSCFGYLNDHTLHHLFPAIDHSKLVLLREVFEETCEEFNVPYKARGTVEMAAGFHRYAQNKQVTPIPSKL